jgi:hypothetical protein
VTLTGDARRRGVRRRAGRSTKLRPAHVSPSLAGGERSERDVSPQWRVIACRPIAVEQHLRDRLATRFCRRRARAFNPDFADASRSALRVSVSLNAPPARREVKSRSATGCGRRVYSPIVSIDGRLLVQPTRSEAEWALSRAGVI